jgi:hypothetical protein
MDKPDAGKAMDSQMCEPSKRELRSRERARSHAALMQKAQAFRTRSIIRFWSRAATPVAAQLTSSHMPVSVRLRTLGRLTCNVSQAQ